MVVKWVKSIRTWENNKTSFPFYNLNPETGVWQWCSQGIWDNTTLSDLQD